MMTTKINPHLARVGTEAHYEDASYYDHAYRQRRQDVLFYADFAAKHGGPVLELGVGTGRVALEIAERGVSVVGVDRMASMLARAKKLFAEQPADVQQRVTLKRGDLKTLRLKKKFPLVISPFNVFMHLYTRKDMETALATVRAHMDQKSTFVFDVLMPDLRALVRDPDKFYRAPVVKHPDGKRYAYAEAFDYDSVNQVQTVTMSFAEMGRNDNSYVTPLLHRQFFPAEMEALLHYNGFRIVKRFGEFDGSALTDQSESQIMVCKLR